MSNVRLGYKAGRITRIMEALTMNSQSRNTGDNSSSTIVKRAWSIGQLTVVVIDKSLVQELKIDDGTLLEQVPIEDGVLLKIRRIWSDG